MLETITADNLTLLIILIVVLCWVLGTVLSARKQIADLRKEKAAPVDELRTKITDQQKQIERQEQRITDLEHRTAKQDQELRLLLRSQLAMLSHLINGNSIEKLEKSMDAINAYLLDQ